MTRPNIVFLHTHNTGRRVEPWGYPVATPRLQALAREGVLFRNAFAPAPTCSPSRSGFLTGVYPHRLGMHGLAHRGFRFTDYAPHLANAMRTAGYTTALAGVDHTKADPHTIGYDRVLFTKDGTADPTGGSEETVAAVSAFLHESHESPFFLSVGIWEAHRPYPEPDPAQPFQDPRYTRPPAGIPDTPETRHDAAAYAASVKLMDDRFGRVLDAIDSAGLRETTLVFAFADHGLQFPNHMATLTDRGLGVFLVARGPLGFEGGVVDDAMVSLLDLPATALEAAGVTPPMPLDGVSLLQANDPAAADRAPSQAAAADAPGGRAYRPGRRYHDELYAELTFHAAYEPLRSIRTARYRYTRRLDGRTRAVLPNFDDSPSKRAYLAAATPDTARNGASGDDPATPAARGGGDGTPDAPPVDAEALYDCLRDPDNLVNTIESHPEVASELRARLARWMEATDDSYARGRAPEVPNEAMVNPTEAVSPEGEVVRARGVTGTSAPEADV